MAISSGVLYPTPPSFIPHVACNQALSDREPPNVSPKLFRKALAKGIGGFANIRARRLEDKFSRSVVDFPQRIVEG
eukprot:15361251-Heterocapsa_arctica.AAC.1